MGTRSITRFIDNWWEGEAEVATLYGQYDGYPDGHGKRLKEALGDFTLVNGMRGTETAPYANGMQCFAAQAIGLLKSGPGGFYMVSADNSEMYEYELRTTKDTEPRVPHLTFKYFDKVYYEGPLKDFDPGLEYGEDD